MHRNEETGQVLNLVMAWAEDGTEMKVDVPLVFKGEDDCPGLKKGLGFLLLSFVMLLLLHFLNM